MVTAVVPLNQVGVATGVVSVSCKVDALASVMAVIGLVARIERHVRATGR